MLFAVVVSMTSIAQNSTQINFQNLKKIAKVIRTLKTQNRTSSTKPGSRGVSLCSRFTMP